jgi:glycosyltransferase involved in cell wall biosynthesis
MDHDEQQDTTLPRVSIVIPVYNRERYLGGTLDSVLAQTFPAWELVIFDDGSTDDSWGVATRYSENDPRIRCVRGPNQGVAGARNRGLLATDGRTDFVIFLDNDDLWEPDALETLIGALDADPAAVSAYGLASCIDHEGRPIPGDDLEMKMHRRMGFKGDRLLPLEPDEPTGFASLVRENFVFTPGIHLVRREVMEQVGLFDPYTAPADDWDMQIRISRIGDIHFVRKRVLLWRRYGQTLSDTSPHWRRAYFRVRDKLVKDGQNTAEQSRLARLAYRRMSRDIGRGAWDELRQRRLKGATRSVAQAGYVYVRYARVMVPTILGR